jgi:hypothetical protein
MVAGSLQKGNASIRPEMDGLMHLTHVQRLNGVSYKAREENGWRPAAHIHVVDAQLHLN